MTGLAGLPDEAGVLPSPRDWAKAMSLPMTIIKNSVANMQATALCVWARLISAPIQLQQLDRIIQASALARLSSAAQVKHEKLR
jgi:hypothetical protein